MRKLNRFKSADIVAAIASAVAGCTTSVSEFAGGDYDTVAIHVSVPGCRNSVSITGYNAGPDGRTTIPARDNVDVDFIELRDSAADSRGGIQTDNQQLAMAAAQIKVLLKRLGFQWVGNHYDEYF